MCYKPLPRMEQLAPFLLVALLLVGPCHSLNSQKCSVQLTTEQQQMPMKLADLATQCLMSGIDSAPKDIRSRPTISTSQTFSRHFCNERFKYESCLNDVNFRAESCLNETDHQVFLCFTDFLKTILTIGCQDNSTIFDNLYYGFNDLKAATFRDSPVEKCFKRCTQRLVYFLTTTNISTGGQMFIFYQEVKSLRDCFTRRQQPGDSEDWQSFRTFLDVITPSMKCIDPRGNRRTLCSEISNDDSLGLPFCPMRVVHDQISIKSRITDTVLKCLKDNRDEKDGEDDTDWRHSDYHNICWEAKPLQNCLNAVTLTSWVCLTRSERKFVPMVADALMTALEISCMNDGEPIDSVTLQYFRDGSDTSLQNDRIKSCLFPSRNSGTPKGTESASHDDMVEFYKGLRSVRDCFVREQRVDKMAVFHTQLIFNTVLRETMCMNPDDGKYVQCQVMERQPTIAENQCPFDISVSGTATTSYSDFINMALTCVSLYDGYISELYAQESLNGHWLILAKHCRRIDIFKQCLSTMAANSKVCLSENLNKKYENVIDLMLVTLNIGCKDNGKKLAFVSYALQKNERMLEQCKVAANERILGNTLQLNNATDSALEVYKAVGEFVNCFSRNITDGDEAKQGGVDFLNQIVQSIHCVGVDGIIWPCVILDNMTS